jgi:hypothetical protein
VIVLRGSEVREKIATAARIHLRDPVARPGDPRPDRLRRARASLTRSPLRGREAHEQLAFAGTGLAQELALRRPRGA